MANEISVSAILIEMEDGTYRANCPDLGIAVEAKNSDDAITDLKNAVIKQIREVGLDKIQLNPVKCMKIKVPV
ncbi:MAG: hypothetical protein HY893_09575 [Deltaproteobacteria bacterium]|nr:hypothetical protein [Deltaproteobacteria bacterium]